MEYTICDENEIILKGNIIEIINLIKNNINKKYYKIKKDEKNIINNKLTINTQFICHRINNLKELQNINVNFGVELDLRDDHKSNKIILAHDPFVEGEEFEKYLKSYNHNTLILNIKSERIELQCLRLLSEYNITNYFFLDSSFPMINLLNLLKKNMVIYMIIL